MPLTWKEGRPQAHHKLEFLTGNWWVTIYKGGDQFTGDFNPPSSHPELSAAATNKSFPQAIILYPGWEVADWVSPAMPGLMYVHKVLSTLTKSEKSWTMHSFWSQVMKRKELGAV